KSIEVSHRECAEPVRRCGCGPAVCLRGVCKRRAAHEAHPAGPHGPRLPVSASYGAYRGQSVGERIVEAAMRYFADWESGRVGDGETLRFFSPSPHLLVSPSMRGPRKTQV